MFRPIRRKKKEMDIDAAKELLQCSRRGVLAVNGDDGYPYAVPVNYFYDSDAGKIYFHGARVGHKVDALKASDKVCFTVYGNETIKEEVWAPFVQSTVVFGRCHLIEDSGITEAKVRELAKKYYPTKEEIDECMAQLSRLLPMLRRYTPGGRKRGGKRV